MGCDESTEAILRLVLNSAATTLAVAMLEEIEHPGSMEAFFQSRRGQLGESHAIAEGYDGA